MNGSGDSIAKGWCSVKVEVSFDEGYRKLPIRPVYLVSCGHGGKWNVFSVGMFAYFSGKPDLVGIGVARSRYSYELIRESGAYVVNVVDEGLMGAVKVCGENSGRNVDKFKLAGLTAVPASRVDAPLVEESPLSLECKVVQVVDVGNRVWFMGEVLATHCREGYDWKDGLLLKWVGEAGKDGLYYKVDKHIGKY